jgi:ubiquinone/menaquinone biosynthesis C-methylase UbiE
MSGWQAYDGVAEAYERFAAPRFENVARHLLAFVRPAEGARLLDLGTGTGAVAVALAERAGRRTRVVVACDLSLPMLIRARHRAPGLCPLLANAAQLPFRDCSFDLVTANCVLSHLQDYRGTLQETLRVLAKPAAFGTSCWGPVSDPYADVWRELLDNAVGDGGVQRAIETVVPWEGYFSSPDNVRTALLQAGFGGVHVQVIDLAFYHSVEEYVADRALGAAGRFARHALGEIGWREFFAQAKAEFLWRFGDRMRYNRPVVLGVGTVA